MAPKKKMSVWRFHVEDETVKRKRTNSSKQLTPQQLIGRGHAGASDEYNGSSSEDEIGEPENNSSDEGWSSGSSDESWSPESDQNEPSSSTGPSPAPASKVAKKGCASCKGCASTTKMQAEDSMWHDVDWEPQKIPFTVTPGPRNAAAELESDQPADFLKLFLTDELLEHIAYQTNLYKSQYHHAHPDSLPHSRANAWKPLSVNELKLFFGLTFLTGIIKKPNLEMYWSVDEMEATPYFPQTMSRNRFQMIRRYLHFNDNASQDAGDAMYKVRPVLDHILQKFRELYQPGQNICINEGLMQWRGSLSFRAYHPQKPVQYGIKSYILCDSATGYCFNMRPYVGESSTLPDIVFSLLDRLPGHGYTLYMSSFYNSVALCEQLLDAKTNVCGTLWKNRGEPKFIREVTKGDLGAGGKAVRHNKRVMVVAWHHKRLVKMVTTCHQDRMQTVEVWQRGHKRKGHEFKPECVVEYSASMNGFDKLEQNVAYYPFIQKTLNWSKKFVAYLFQLAMFNAFVLFQEKNPGKCDTLLDFIRRVTKTWTQPRVGNEKEVAGKGTEGNGEVDHRQVRAPYKTDPESRLDGDMSRHTLEKLLSSGGKKGPVRRCRVCARKGWRRETRMWCKSCCVPLHPECFTVYHTKTKFWV